MSNCEWMITERDGVKMIVCRNCRRPATERPERTEQLLERYGDNLVMIHRNCRPGPVQSVG